MCIACSALFRYNLKEVRVCFSSSVYTYKTARTWIFEPEFSHFLFNHYRKGFQSFKYSALMPGCKELIHPGRTFFQFHNIIITTTTNSGCFPGVAPLTLQVPYHTVPLELNSDEQHNRTQFEVLCLITFS